MKIISLAIVAILFSFALAGQAYASPKVTQAASINFKVNDDLIAMAVEELGKPPMIILQHGKNTVFSAEFDKSFTSADEFAYTNSFLRFRFFNIKGLPDPILLAVAVSPGGSDVNFEIKIISEKTGKISLLNPKSIFMSIQNGIYLGFINSKYGYGMITWEFQWDAAHYDPHTYKISIYTWDNKNLTFTLNKEFITQRKFKDGPSALKYYGLPYRNFRDEVTKPEEDLGTLGIEKELLESGANKN